MIDEFLSPFWVVPIASGFSVGAGIFPQLARFVRNLPCLKEKSHEETE